MIPGVVAANTAFAGAATMWTPLNMATVPQIYLDAEHSVITEVGGACSAISNLGAMGAAGDFFQATAANRPTILDNELNGNRVLRFDGLDDIMRTAGATARSLFASVQTAWTLAIYKKRSVEEGLDTAALFQSTVGSGTGSRFAHAVGIGISGSQNSPTLLGRALDANGQSNLYGNAAHAQQYVIVLCAFNTIERWGRIYINGSLALENLSYIAASYATTSGTASNSDLSLGGFTAGSGYSDVDLAAFIAGRALPGGSLSANEIDRLAGWAAHEKGLTANLPAGHPYKTTAPTI